MAVTATNLNSLAKEIYGDEVINLIPESMLMCKDYKFREAKSTGDNFIQPCKMTHEHGFTYSSEEADAFALNAAVPAIFKDAQVDGSSIVLRSALSYVQLAKLDNSKKGFMSAPSALLEDMNQSMWKRLEIAAFYGRSSTGIGVVSSVGSITSNAQDVIITQATFAPGFWTGSEGAYIDFYSDFSAGTKRNSNDISINSATITDRTINIQLNASETGTIATGDVIVWKGAYNTEPIGLDKIVNNTGTLYNIDAGTYSLWQSSINSSVGAMTLADILETIDLAVNKGLEGDCNVYIPTIAYTPLSNEQSALRRHGDKIKEANNGFTGLQFFHQTGVVNVKPSIYVKQGEFFVCPVVGGHRIGASDVTFKTPGMPDEELFHQLESSAGVGLRCFSHQAVFFEKPAHLAKGTGVTYS